MDLSTLRVNGARLQHTLEEMAKIGATPAGGVQRLALSDEDKRARDLFVSWLKEIDCEITIDLKNPPARAGSHGTYHLGPCEVEADVWSKQSADHSHRFWHGLENPIASVARGKVKQGGNVVAMLKLLPVVRRAFEMFPIALRELGYDDMVLTGGKG